MLGAAEAELARRVGELLVRDRLLAGAAATKNEAEIESFSTPRRIAVLAHGVADSQPDVDEQVMGPATKIAFKDGEPTPAAHAFAKKVGVPLDQIQKITTPKGEYLAAKVLNKGRTAAQVLAESLPKEIAGIYWAKSMHWRAGAPERFVRPLRWMVALLDGEVVPFEFGGVKAGKASRGHRILGDGSFEIAQPMAYVPALASAKVV